MTDVLEHEGNFGQSDFCSQKIVMIVLQFSVREMVPPACIQVSGIRHTESRVTHTC